MEEFACDGVTNKEYLIIGKLQSVEREQLKLEKPSEINIFFTELHLSNFSTLSLKNITKVVVIGQPISCIKDLSNAELLKELWLPECSIQKIGNFESCLNLRKLYLYSNLITQIEGLDSLKRLMILSLSGNNITEIKNIHELEELQELYLSGNEIKFIGKALANNKNLKILNLSGNPIHNINDIFHLPDVEYLEFSDSVYKKCPIASLCNYRSLIVFQMPHLKYLDSFCVDAEERADTLEYFSKKIIYYNAIQNQSRYKYYFALNEKQKESDIRKEIYKESLYSLKVKEIQCNMWCFSSLLDIPTTFIEAKQKAIRLQIQNLCLQEEQEKSLIEQNHKMQVSQINMELHYGGNVKFRRHTLEKKKLEEYQKILQSFACHNVFNQLKILSIKVTDATEIISKGLECLHQHLCRGNHLGESSWGYYLLFGFYNTKMDLWKHLVPESDPLYLQETIVRVTNCIAISDYEWLQQMKISCDSPFGHYGEKIRDRRTAVIVKAHYDDLSPESLEEIYLCHDKANEYRARCKTFKVKCKYLLIPKLITEYEYVFEENIERQKHLQDEAHDVYPQVEKKTKQTTDLKILDTNALSLKFPENFWHSLSKLSLQATGIESITINVCLPNIRMIDLSYNALLTLSGLDSFPNATDVDVSFNNICSMADMMELKNLKRLDISWNKLDSIISVIKTLKRSTPHLENLEMSFNPVTDVKDNIHKMHLARKDLFLLTELNGKHVERHVNVIKSTIDVSPKFSLKFSYEQLNKLTILWKCNQLYEHLGCTGCLTLEIDNDFLCIVWRNKCIDLIDCADELKNLKWANLDNNYIMSLEFLRLSPFLEELSISNNLLNAIDETLLKLNRLVKLDLSNNYIYNISCLSKSYFPTLKILNISNNLIKTLSGIEACPALIELYLYQNNINTLDDLNNLKGCINLVVVDLSSNKVERAENFRAFISFHLPMIEVINGKYIRDTHIKDTKQILGNCLDQNYLINRNKVFDVNLMTELTLDNCSLKKINLKAKMLPNLISLDLTNNKITSLWGLQELPKLKTLCLSHNCVNFTTNDKQILQSLDERTTVEKKNHLQSSNQISKITQISYFPGLEILYLNNNGINSLIPLYIERMKNLQALFLHGNELSCIRGLENAKELKYLVLDGNRIETIDILEIINITKLKDLHLEINRIKDLSFVTKLTSLRRVFLSRNKISEYRQVKHLECLQYLEEITLYGNPLFHKIHNYHMLPFSLSSVKRIDGIYVNLEQDEKRKTEIKEI